MTVTPPSTPRASGASSYGPQFGTPPPKPTTQSNTPPTTQGYRAPALVLPQKEMHPGLEKILKKTNLTEAQKEIINALRNDSEIIITGSTAIAILQVYCFDRDPNFISELIPNDVDLLQGDYKGNNRRAITPLEGTAKIKGKEQQTSISVEHCTPKTTSNDKLFIDIYDLKVHCPEQLLKKYTDHNEHKKETIKTKLDILTAIDNFMRECSQ